MIVTRTVAAPEALFDEMEMATAASEMMLQGSAKLAACPRNPAAARR